MALNPSNRSNLEQVALKGLKMAIIQISCFADKLFSTISAAQRVD